VVGVLQRDPAGIYAEQWLGGVDAAGEHDCDLICFFGRELDESGFRKQANTLYDLVTEQTVDGLVVWTTGLGFSANWDRVTEFCARFDGLPMVAVEEHVGRSPVVLLAERQAMDEAVSHLIEVHGHRRIGFVRGPRTHPGAQRRYQGYLDAMARHGLPVPAELVSEPVPDPELVAAPVTRMLRSALPPDAIATAHDDFAMYILATVSAAGLATPDDVAVIGFDDRTDLLPGGRLDSAGAPRGHYFTSGPDWPRAAGRPDDLNALSLTTVRAPFYDLGRRAVELVLRLVRGETVPEVTELPAELIIRRTCGCPSETPVVARPGDDLADELRGALTDRLARLPDDWAERLARAYLARDGHGFRTVLDEVLPASLWSGDQVEQWWRVLSTLRRLGVDPYGEELLRYGQTLLTETAEKYWRYGHVLGEKRGQIVREVGHELITAPDVTGVAEALARELPKLGVPSCYLASYEPVAPNRPDLARTRSRLLLAYEHGALVDVPTDAVVYPSAALVPGDRLARPAPSAFVALPLYFRDEQLGFVLFEVGPRIGWLYTTVQEQLSSALHRAMLIENDRAALAAVEEAHRRAERQRLAGELHDSISQALFSMTLHTRALQLAIQQDGADPEGRVAKGLADLRELTQSALAEVRALILQMRPESLHEEGLVVTLRRHTASVAAREGLDFGFRAPERPLRLDEQAEEELFRVVQEAVHNSVKHARARRIELSLWTTVDDPSGTLVVEIADDGTGFDPDLPRPGHLGLHIMRERVERIGGRLTVDSAPSRSTTIRAILPGALVQEGDDTT
jgi:signal transduction histidine kinase/DNA-binding LacI/PurR family transcriptional regulator